MAFQNVAQFAKTIWYPFGSSAETVHAMLRPYQKDGYTWLNYMQKLGFGACLADDMGLGKTLQVLCYLEK